jgi:Tfp pilus assembly protein PilF
MYPVYVRALIYLAAKRAGEAAAEFHKILAHLGVVQTEPIGSLAQLGLARAYALQQNSSAAKDAYKTFFTLWKGADSDIAVFRDAKSEFAKLK